MLENNTYITIERGLYAASMERRTDYVKFSMFGL